MRSPSRPPPHAVGAVGRDGDRHPAAHVSLVVEVHCERSVSKALEAVPGVEKVLEVSRAGAVARVAAGPEVTADQIENAVAKAGYRARVKDQPRHAESPAVISRGRGEFDLVIVGGGSAGFAAAIKAADLGACVALAEGGTLGGTCVNVGCVPSKTLIRASEAQHRRVHHGFQGIPITDGRPDWATVRAEKDALVAELRQAKYRNVLRAYPTITLFEERATLASGNKVRLASGRTLGARKILVTSGASPWAPQIPGLAEARYLDNTSAMAQERLPESLIVIGASAVGLELAQMFARLGVRVTVLEALPRVVPAEDKDIGNALGGHLREEGLETHVGIELDRVRRSQDGYGISFREGAASRTVRAEQLLVATGRRANTGGFGLDGLGVTRGKKGEIVVNEFLQTTNPDVYAAGDVIGDPMFVYVAAYGGALAAENALTGNARRYDLTALPRVTFTDPADASSRRLVGAPILAAEAGEMITEPALAITFGLTIEDLTSAFHPYLTLSEGIKLAAQAFTKDVGKLSCCAV